MRKRRRLADKLTIMVCAVLVAVSAFFYAPMDVEAEELSTSVELSPVSLSDFDFSQLGIPSTEQGANSFYDGYVNCSSSRFDLVNRNGDLDSVYAVTVSGSVVANSDYEVYLRNAVLSYSEHPNYAPYIFFTTNPTSGTAGSTSSVYDFSAVIYGYGRDLCMKRFNFHARTLSNFSQAINFTFDFNINVDSVVKLTGEDSASYQQGYNAGYSAGEQAGEDIGYSNGFEDGFEQGESQGYESGFQAGQDSVDTQSYYDAGYQAGYDAGYASGYDTGFDTGYDAGWSAYESQMDKWGADTSDYPLKMSSFSSASQEIIATVFTSVPSISYEREVLFDLNFDINPNHTYKYVVKARGVGTGLYDALFSDYDLNLSIGSNKFDISRSGFERAFYIPGYNMDSLTCLEMYVYDGVYYGGVSEEDGFLKHIGHVSAEIYDFFIDVYDMGPSGDMQNHIANQTDKLTNGFNDSKGNSVNSDFSSGLNDFETAEDSLFATATTGLKDFTFFDIQSVPAMVTGMSFVGSIMSGWFTQAGGASGVGIVLSILFSIMLVAMVLGLYRWYQSKGGKD